MILLDNRTDTEIELKKLEKICNFLEIAKDVELIVTTNSNIQEYNREYRGINKATDVLSFPLEDIPHMPLGTIIISIDKVKEVANNLKHSIDDEITLLFIHGLLHLLGYDHEVDNGEMRKVERELINQFKLPNSLIIRTEGE